MSFQSERYWVWRELSGDTFLSSCFPSQWPDELEKNVQNVDRHNFCQN
jgi:hypothetical protein